MLAQALESVFAQTYQDFEVVVVDDGSTDNTPLAIHEYGDKIIALRCDNGGRSRARNAGIAAASGRYISFLDDDDRWLPRKLERQVQVLEQRQVVDLVYSSLYVVREGRRSEIWNGLLPADEESLERLLWNEGVVTPSGIMIRKSMLDRVGLFDPSVEPCEDWDFMIRAAFQDACFHLIEEPLVEYRIHGANSMCYLDRMNEGRAAVLRKVFATPALPPFLRARRRTILSGWWLRMGNDSYNLSEFRKARRLWLEAVKLDPSLITPRMFILLLKASCGASALHLGRRAKRVLTAGTMGS